MATRTLGFRLEFKGSKETELALESVKKKMQQIKTAIDQFQNTPLTVKTSFDTAEINKAQKELEELKITQKELIKENKAYIQSNKQLADNIPKDSIIGLRFEISKLNKELNGLSQADREGAKGQELIKSIKEKDAVVRKFNEELNRFQHNVGNYKSAFGAIGGSLQGFGDKFLRVSSLITGGLIGAGLLGLLNGVKAFGQASITEFTQAETALAKIKQQLIATGNASGKTAEGLRETAKELQTITGIDDDKILEDVTSTLISFTNIQGEAFDRTQKAAIDLSATMKGDLKGAALLAGKAIEEPEKAAGRLAKAGVILDKQTQQAIATAVKQNDTTKAQIIVLEALEGKFKGVSDAIQDSSLKNVRSFNVFFQNLKEGFGESIISAFNSIAVAFQRFNENATAGTKETKAAISQLNAEFSKEKEAIKNTFDALKDKNTEDGVRKKLIDDIVKKYPEYLDKLTLEKASFDDLIKIEGDLTETVKKATFERILLHAKEAAAAAEDAERIRIARLKTGDESELDLLTKLKVAAKEGLLRETSGKFRKEAIAEEVKQGEVRLSKLKDQNKNIEAELLKGLEKEFGVIDKSRQIAKKELGKSGSTFVDPEATKKAIDELENQLKRIEEIRRQNADRTADLIANEFDKKIQQAKLKAQNSLADLQAEANKLSANGISATDQKQLDQIKIQSDLIREGLSKEIGTIEQERLKAITTFKQSLVDSRNELLTLINESNVKLSEGKINTELFNQDKRLSILKQSYETDILNLEIALKDKLITQEEFDKQSLIITGTYSANVEKEVLRSNKVLKDLYQQQFKDKKAALEQAAKINIAQEEKNALSQAGQIDPSFSAEQKALALITIEQAKSEKIKGINKDRDAEILKSSQDLQKKIIDLKDNEIAAHEAAAKAQVAITKEQAAEIEAIILALSGIKIDIKVNFEQPDQSKLKDLRDKAVSIAEEVSGAISQIERNNSEQGFDKRKSDIEKEYDNRIKLAKGNSAEVERLEREKDQKLKVLEREQANRRKQQAIKEAIINTALGIVKAIPNVFLMAFAALAGGLQLAVINSQKFAKGGYAKQAGGYTGQGGYQAPPDETGYRPVDAILHEGEHVSTEKQVTRNRILYEIIEKDRIRTNNGQRSTLNEDIIKFAEIKKQALYGQRANQAPIYTPVIPYIIPSASSRVTKIEFSDEHIDKIAKAIADKVESGSFSGSFTGSKNGMVEAVKQELRQERQSIKSQV